MFEFEKKRAAAEKKKRLDQEKMQLLATLHRDEADKEAGASVSQLFTSHCKLDSHNPFFWTRNPPPPEDRKQAKEKKQEDLAERYWKEQAELRAQAEDEKTEAEGEKRLETEAEEGKRLENEDDGGTCPYCVGACPVWCVSMYGKV